jgi:hypothetical protein
VARSGGAAAGDGRGRRADGVSGLGDQLGSLDVVPTFIGPNGVTDSDFMAVADTAPGRLDLDVVALGSMLSFQYVLDGRSLLAQVRRRRWLESLVSDRHHPSPAALAGYGRQAISERSAAKELVRRLRAELERSFGDAERVTLLLSGGLDSRLAGALLVGLARQGRVTDDIRAVTWGIPESRDRHYAARVAQRLGVTWIPLELGPADLTTNIELAACQLGALVSPVHLHAVHAVSQLDWRPGDRILASTLGNGVGRGTYLYRHVTYARSIQPYDWLGFMHPDRREWARAQLVDELAAFRRRLRGRPRVAVHECEMLAHYVSGLFLPVFGLLARRAAPVHQALSDPATYGFLWSLSPCVRTGSMYRIALRMCGAQVSDVPYALTSRPLRRMARREQNGLSPFVHRYPRWIAHDLADTMDDALCRDWFDATGCLDGAAIRRTWEAIRRSPDPHPPTAYLLIWLCALRRLGEELSIDRPRNGHTCATTAPAAAAPASPTATGPGGSAASGRRRPSPPWGFAGRVPRGRWRRLAALPRQGVNVLGCIGRARS